MARKATKKAAMAQETVEPLAAVDVPWRRVPGYERPAADLLKKPPGGLHEGGEDRMGNVFFTLEGAAPRPRIVLPAHLDEIGLMVKFVDEKGFIRFWHAGRLVEPGAAGAAGERHQQPRRGHPRRRRLQAPAPPHRGGAQQGREAGGPLRGRRRLIQGGSGEGARHRPGRSHRPRLALHGDGGRQAAARQGVGRPRGVALIVRVLEELKRPGHPNTVIGCGTVQEEVGTRGAEDGGGDGGPGRRPRAGSRHLRRRARHQARGDPGRARQRRRCSASSTPA